MFVTLAVDSAFSIIEGVSASVSDKFRINPKRQQELSVLLHLLFHCSMLQGQVWHGLILSIIGQTRLI